MLQELANKICRRVSTDSQHNDAVALVTEVPFIETSVVREKGGSWQNVQQGQNIISIIHALDADIVADLFDMKMPASKLNSLAFENVFVEQKQAAGLRFLFRYFR